MRLIGKVLVLVLVFTLGFASAFGALFGAGYYAYTKVSLDSVGVNTDNVFDKDAAEVHLSAMTIEGLVSEFQALQGISDKLSLDMLIARYGLMIPDEVIDVLPATARALPLAELFTEDGVMIVLDELYIGQLLSYERGELIPDTDGEYNWYFAGTTDPVTGLYSVLVNYTIADLIAQNFDINIIMEKLTVATVLNLHSDEYSDVYISDEGSLVPVTDLEEAISVWRTNQGVKVSSTIAALADIPVSQLSTSLDDISVASLLGFVEYSDDYYSYEISEVEGKEALVLTEQSGITAELSDLNIADFSNGGIDDKINEMKIATVLGYTYNEEDGKYYDSDGEAATGVTAVIVGSAIGEVGSDINNVMIGEVCGFTKVEDADGNITWYSTYSNSNPEQNVKAEGIMVSIADLTIDQLSDNNAITSRIETLTVAEALGYKKNVDGDGFIDKNGKPVGGVMGVIADSQLNNIQSKIDESSIGELFGYTKDGDTWYTKDDDGNLKKVSGVMASIADSTIDSIDSNIDNVLVGDIYGYTKGVDEEGNDIWYSKYYGEGDERNVVATGAIAAIADAPIGNIDAEINTMRIGEACGYTKVGVNWYSEYYGPNYPERNVKATGVMAKLADLTIEELNDNDKITECIETMTVADALGYAIDDDGNYLDKEGNLVTGVMGVLAGTELNSIQATVDSTEIGKITGFTKIGDTWYTDAEGTTEAGGIMIAIADLKVSELKNNDKLTECIEKLTVADALGYTLDGDGNYVDKNGNAVSGVMGVLAGTKLNGIQGTVDNTKIGKITGFTKDGDKWYTDTECTTEAGGIMNAIADLTVSDLKDSGKLANKIQTIKVADALGYTLDANGNYVDKNGNPVSGVMGVIAGTELAGIQTKVDTSLTGELMGLAPVYADDGETIISWKDKNGAPVHVLMNKIASTPFTDIGNLTDNLSIGDIIPESQRESGFMTLIKGDTQLDEIAPEVNRVFTETTLHVFISKDIIKVNKKEAFINDDGTPTMLGSFTLNEIMEKLGSGDI